MSAITGAQLQTVTDSIAKQIDILIAAVGDTTTAATILYGQQENATRILAYSEDAIADLGNKAVYEKSLMDTFKYSLDLGLIRGLENHLRRVEGLGISDYWAAELATRIAGSFAIAARSIGIYLDPTLVFPPVTNLGSFVASGSGAGIFTDGLAVDLGLYGSADLEGEITAKGGSTVTLTATVTGKDENGSVQTGTITFAAAGIGDKVALVPTMAGAKFYDITNITISGGAASDAFKVQTKYDRSLSL